MPLDPNAHDLIWMVKTGRAMARFFTHLIVPSQPEIKLKPCLLVVEDDKAQREILHYYLRALGYKPDVVTTAEAGMALIQEKKHHLAFVDIRLPLMSGLELAKQIMEVSPSTHVIIMAGYAPDLAELNKGQYVGVIVKPFEITDVEDAIRKTSL